MTGGEIGGRPGRDEAFGTDPLGELDDHDVADLWVRDPDTGAFRMRTPEDDIPAAPPAPRRGRSPVDRASARAARRAREEDADPAEASGAHEAVPAQRRRGRTATDAEPAARTARRRSPGAAGGSGAAGRGAGRGGSGKADGKTGGTAGGKAKKRVKRTMIALVTTVAVLVGGGCGYLYYLNSRIATTDKDAGDDLPKAAADEFGRRPINVLLIGNDSRIGEGAKYGSKGHAGLADVGILMHVSADRSNATFVSIPRDTMVQIPRCVVDGKEQPNTPRFDAFNESFGSGGAPCTVSTVQRMLGLEIDHYIMIKFKGVRDLTTAVGGVTICTEKGINDPVIPGVGGTGLKLPPGPQKIQGEQALGFLRTRHAQGSDGSDLSRVEQQKVFMMSLMQELKNSARFSNIDGMLKIAQIATGAIQVDNGLADIRKLANLGQQLQKVPAKRMVFTTLPYKPAASDANRVEPKEPEANRLWEAIRNDRPLTKGDGTPAPEAPKGTAPVSAAPVSAAPAPTTDPSAIRVAVDNTTTRPNKATSVVNQLKAAKFQAQVSAVDLSPRVLNNSVIRFPQGKEDAARVLARAVGLPDTAIEPAAAGVTQLQLLIGEDFPAAPAPGATAPPEAGAPQATDQDLRAQTADQDLCKVKTKR